MAPEWAQFYPKSVCDSEEKKFGGRHQCRENRLRSPPMENIMRQNNSAA
jgi:hypothetical protein